MCVRQPILVWLPSSHDWDPCCPSCCPCTWSAWRRAWMGGPGSKDPRFFWIKGKHTHTHRLPGFFLASWLRCCHSCHSRSSSLGIHWVVLWQRWARWTWLRPSALGSEGWLTWRINGRLLSVWSVLWLLWSTYLIFLLFTFLGIPHHYTYPVFGCNACHPTSISINVCTWLPPRSPFLCLVHIVFWFIEHTIERWYLRGCGLNFGYQRADSIQHFGPL